MIGLNDQFDKRIFRIQRNKPDFICEYPFHSHIKRTIVKHAKTIEADSEGAVQNSLDKLNETEEYVLEIEFVDGRSILYPLPKQFVPVYMEQYGISVSEDGELFFLQDWYARGGLSCYEINTGKQIWRLNKRHARETYVDGDYILCFFDDTDKGGVARISIKTGEIIKRYPCGGVGSFYKISKDRYLLPPRRNICVISDAELEIFYKVPWSIISKRGFFDHCARLEGTVLTIKGMESSKEEEELQMAYYIMKSEGRTDKTLMERIHKWENATGTTYQENGSFSHPEIKTLDIAPYAVR